MEIEFITEDEVAAKNFAVEPIKNNLPEWYKNLPVEYETANIEYYIQNPEASNKTIKACKPVLDYLTSGYIIKANHTVLLKNIPFNRDNENFSYYATNRNSVYHHKHSQCPIKIEGKNKTYIKLDFGWRVKTPKGYSTLFYQPYYSNFEKKFDLFPAIVDTDLHDNRVLFPGWIANHYEEIEIQPGDPVMCVFPFKRDEWKMKITVQKEPESIINRFLTNKYSKLFWQKKTYE